jgi:outer membrane protein assembly factor BamB
LGPVKEIKYQIEDGYDDNDSFADNPNKLDDITESFFLINDNIVSLSGNLNRNFSLASYEQNIYAPVVNGKIFSINYFDNQLKWTYKHSSSISSGIFANDEYIYFSDVEGYVCSLNVFGKLQWKKFVGEILSPPLTVEDLVYVKTTNNIVYALNEIDGSEAWTYNLSPSSLTLRSWGGLSFSDNKLFIGTSSGRLTAIDAKTGLLIWETTYSQPKGPSDIERANDTTSTPIVDDFFVYTVSSDGNVAVISKSDGSIVWSRALSSFFGLAVDKKNIYITHNSGSIYSLDKQSNNVLWRNNKLAGRDSSKPYLFDNYILVSDYEGYLHVLDKESGEFLSRLKVADSILTEPIIIDNSLIIIADLTGSIHKIKFSSAEINKSEKNNDFSEKDEKQISKDKSISDLLFFWE